MKKLVKTLAEFKKSNHGLKNPEKADLNKDNELSDYEIKIGKAMEDSMDDEEEVNEEVRNALDARLKMWPIPAHTD